MNRQFLASIMDVLEVSFMLSIAACFVAFFALGFITVVGLLVGAPF